MGRYHVNFECHHCGHCCTEVICLPTPWDVIRIVRDTRANPYKFLRFIGPDDISGVEKNDPTWLDVGGKPYMMSLRRKKAKTKPRCFFLDKKTRFCTIYESRPILCRLFPFNVHETRAGELKGFTLHQDVECPRHRDGVVETEPLYALYLDDSKHQQDYADLVRVFNGRTYRGKKPEDFIEMFVEVRRKPK